MGLDMYLSQRRYVSRFTAKTSVEQMEKTDLLESLEDLMELERGSIEYVIVRRLYWRKANQIHGWFVHNIQDDEDDCEEYKVSFSELQHLLSDVKAVLEDNSRAEELLPTTAGCFFGDNTYSQYYFEDLKETAEKLEKILQSADEYSQFYYQASW